MAAVEPSYKIKKGWQSREKAGVLAQFTEDEINAIMAGILANCNAKGAHVAGQEVWSEENTIIRRQFILDLVARGWSNAVVEDYLMTHWGCCLCSARNYRKDALKALVETNDDIIEQNRNKQIERLEKMVVDCQNAGKMKEAAMFMEQISKLQGLYIDKKEVVIKDYQTTFNFGEE